MATLDPVADFVELTVAQGYDETATQIDIVSLDVHWDLLPDPTVDGPYNLLWYDAVNYWSNPQDDPNREWVRVTNWNEVNKRLIVTRAQEGTAATTKNTSGATYKMIMAIGAKFRNDIEDSTVDVGSKYAWITEYDGVGDGVTDDHGAFDDAVADGITHIIIPEGTWRFADDHTFADTVTLEFLRNAQIAPDTGKTVTINGPIIAGNWQIFSGSGTVTITNRAAIQYERWDGTSTNQVTIPDLNTTMSTLTLAQSGNVTVVDIDKTGTGSGNVLDIHNDGTGYAVIVHQDGSSPVVKITQDTANTAIVTEIGASTTDCLTTKVVGDNYDRFAIRTDGQVRWSDGTNVPDTYLYRSAADTLKTDDAFESATSIKATTVFKMTPRTAAPGSPASGDIAIADRSTWDPCSLGDGGQYPAIYDGSAWKAIFPFKVVESAEIVCDVGGGKTCDIAHGLSYTPSAKDVCVANAYRSSGSGDVQLRTLAITGIDGTNVSVYFYVINAGSSGTKAKVVLWIRI